VNQYVSILRGINVGGTKKIVMTDLKALYLELGFQNVVTYIQSGNIVFSFDKSLSENDLVCLIQDKIFKKYSFKVPVIIRSFEELKNSFELNPYLNSEGILEDKLHFTFLDEHPSLDVLDFIKTFNYEPDQFVINGRTVYLYCPNGYGNTKLTTAFFEDKLKVKATTRNFKTTLKLLDLLS